jgi:hypothetical protein
VPKKPLEGSLKSFRTWPALDPGNDHQLQDGTSRHTRNVRGLPLPRTVEPTLTTFPCLFSW